MLGRRPHRARRRRGRDMNLEDGRPADRITIGLPPTILESRTDAAVTRSVPSCRRPRAFGVPGDSARAAQTGRWIAIGRRRRGLLTRGESAPACATRSLTARRCLRVGKGGGLAGLAKPPRYCFTLTRGLDQPISVGELSSLSKLSKLVLYSRVQGARSTSRPNAYIVRRPA